MAFAPREGGAETLVDLLSGSANFSGRLPLSVPKSASAVPYTYNHSLKSAGTPIAYHFGSRFPFGFGQSYTHFEYGALQICNDEVAIDDGTVEMRFELRNAGRRAGTEVVQVYVRDKLASVVRPVREPKAFSRVPLEAGELATVSVRIPVDMLNFTDARGERIVELGDFELMIGSFSGDLYLAATVTVSGQHTRTLPVRWRMLSEVTFVVAGAPQVV